MNSDSNYTVTPEDRDDIRPILIVPYMWIGDFVRGHTVVRVLKQRWPNRPVDLLVTSLCAPLVDYMPGVRAGIVWDLPRSRLAVAKQWGLAAQLRDRGLRHGAGDAPHLEVGHCAGAGRYSGTGGVCRRGQVRADQPLALGREGPAPLYRQERRAGAARWRAVAAGMAGAAACGFPPRTSARWRQANGLGTAPAIALAPGSVGASKRWTYYPEAARLLAQQGLDVWVVGGPGEKALAAEIVAAGGPRVRDLTGTDLRNGILAVAAAKVAISNDSGLMHIAAAVGNADHGHFRSHQPLSLGAAQRPRGDGADQNAAILPTLPAHRSAP